MRHVTIKCFLELSRGRNLVVLLLIFALKTPAPPTGLRLAAILDVKNPAGLEGGGTLLPLRSET